MFAFGHYFSTYFLIKWFGSKEERRIIILLSLAGLLPDIDIILPVPHRGFFHHLYFFLPEFLFYNAVLYTFFRKRNLYLPFLIHLMHVFSDSLFGPVEVLPSIRIVILDLVSAEWDFLYGSFFLLLSFFYDLKFKNLEH